MRILGPRSEAQALALEAADIVELNAQLTTFSKLGISAARLTWPSRDPIGFEALMRRENANDRVQGRSIPSNQVHVMAPHDRV